MSEFGRLARAAVALVSACGLVSGGHKSLVIGECAVQVVIVFSRDTPIVEGFGVIGLEADGFLIVR